MRQLGKNLKVLLLSIGLCSALAVGVTCVCAAGCKDKEEDITLKFNVDGGVAISDVTAEKGETITLPIPEKAGYKFEGWYLNANFEGLPVESVRVDGSATYYAKWTKLYAITLDLNGGFLSTTMVYAESGASVYDAVKDLQPTKDGFVFGAWFNNGKELNKNTRLTEAGITLTAEYKVEYTVNVYLQNINDDDYTLSEELSYVGADYVGTLVTIDTEMDGCTQIEKDGDLVSQALTDVAANNAFSVYYDRNEYKVVFNPNAPDGSDNGHFETTVRYGATVEIPFDTFNYFIDGYCMLGWSTGVDSKEIVHKTNLDALLYNKTEEVENETQEITVLRPTTYYGVWQAGATDAFGGSDYIYTLEGEEGAIYLVRGNVFFKGEYDAETGAFTFYDYSKDEFGEYVVGGKMLGGGKFLFSNSERMGHAVSCTHNPIADPSEQVKINENIKITYDEMNGITYTVYDAESGLIAEESKGTYECVSLGEYRATFTEGPLAGQTKQFLVAVLTAGDVVMDGFLERNDADCNLGKVYLTGITDNGIGGYSIVQTESVYVELNGYGVATFTANDEEAAFYYGKDANGNYQLVDGSGQNAGVFKLTSDIGLPVMKNGYILYDYACDGEFQLANGAKLKIDGACMATYANGAKVVNSYYVAQALPMGGSLVSIVDANDNNKVYKFVVRLSDSMDYYVATEVPATYAEYYYKNEASVYYAPTLVIDETEVGKASVYGMTGTKAFVKVAEGTYEEVNGEYGMYLFTATEKFDASETISDPMDLSAINSFVFAINDRMFSYNVHYWFETNGEAKSFSYTEKNGEGTLMIVAGVAYYKALPTIKPTFGTYTETLPGYITFTDATGQNTSFFLDSMTMTYQKLEHSQFIAYLLQSNNLTNTKEYLNLNGLGHGIYYYTKGEGEDAEFVGENGVEIATGKKTAFGAPIYRFESSESDVAFDFIISILSENYYFLKQEKLYGAGEFRDINNPTSSLKLDGYCSEALYMLDGKAIEGNYYVTDEGVIIFLNKERTVQYTFDVKGEGLMTTRGQEEGVYVFFENSYSASVYCAMDGYGKLSVFTLVKNEKGEYERNYITQDGVYEVDGDYFILTYEENGKTVTYTYENRKSNHYAIDRNPYLILMHEQEMDRKVLIDTTDWAVLILDNFNNAIKYDAYGQKQKGNYTVITDNLLYFLNEDGTDACIYDYDMETGAASPVDLSKEAKMYYTTDLQSLVFSKYGFAIFNGDTENPVFYTVENGNTIVYRNAEEGEDLGGKEVSKYGFVKENFGKLGATVEYNGVTYYKSTGSDIRFTREESNLDTYPINLGTETWKVNSVQFTPGGGLEFMVSGVADVTFTSVDEESGEVTGGNRTVNCSVGRELDEEGNAKLFIVIEGYFRLYIDATYSGVNNDEGNTYVAEGLRYYQYLYSTMFLDEFYRTYTRYGAARANALENEYGYLTLNVDFDEEGKELEYYVSGEFGKKSGFYDTNGELLTKIEKSSWLSIGTISYASVMMNDGYEYRLYFGQTANPYLGIVGYYVYSFVRVQKFEMADGYTVEVGKSLTSDIFGIPIDDVFFMSVTKGDELDTDDKYVIDTTRKTLYQVDGVWYCADREYFKDPEYALEANYYLITVEENESTTVGEGDDEIKISSTYKSVTLQVVKTEIVRAGEVRKYVEIIEVENSEGEKESKVAIIALYNNVYIVTECTYDEATQTYTVKTEEGRRYTITRVNESTVEIVEL